MYEDKTLICKDCHKEFVFTAGEQEFYAEKGFVNEPQRCKACRQAKKASTMYEAVFILIALSVNSVSPKLCFRPFAYDTSRERPVLGSSPRNIRLPSASRARSALSRKALAPSFMVME